MTKRVEFSDSHCLPSELVAREDIFEYLMQLQGQSYRKVATRDTLKITLAERSYFIKKHFGVGWLEILKNWLTFKCPIVSSLNEVHAIHALQALGIATTPYVAHGLQGVMPAHIRSFLLTEDLGDIVTLEDLAMQWQIQPPSLRFKRAIIRHVAEIACKLHTHGIYHRDFYICHFCFKREEMFDSLPMLYLLDLHRASIRKSRSTSLQIKDLAALYFSTHPIQLNAGDIHTFLKNYATSHYSESRDFLKMLNKVSARAKKLYEKYLIKMNAGIKM